MKVQKKGKRKGALNWDAQHTFSDDSLIEVGPGRRGAIFHMVRHQNCGGESKVIDTVCNAVRFK